MKVLTSDSELEELSRDAGLVVARPRKGFLAATEGDVQEVLAEAAKLGVPVTPRGAGTSIPSQAVGSGYVLLQEGHRVDVGPDGVARCDPAVVKSDLNRRLDAAGIWVPVDTASYRSCTVGGMAANNSSGARTLKYGSTADYVQELQVVFPEAGPFLARPLKLEDALHAESPVGDLAGLIVENQKAIAEDAPRVTKNSSGYRRERVVHDGLFDMPKLLVGSEGTLAVSTNVALGTRPKPVSKALVVFEADLRELDRVASALRTHSPSAVELVDKSVFRQTGREKMIAPFSKGADDYMVFAEFDGAGEPEILERIWEVADDKTLAQFDPLVLEDPADAAKAWDARNETLTIAGEMRRGSRVPLGGVEDVVVPPERLGAVVKLFIDLFRSKGLDYVSYGHAGDANLHTRPLLDPGSEADLRIMHDIMEECFEAVWKMGGSMTGEHGDGRLRAPFVERQYRRTYWIMKEVKRILDPRGLLNPGVKV
jgi:glycolate dehydrogenase FAD-linked subunit